MPLLQCGKGHDALKLVQYVEKINFFKYCDIYFPQDARFLSNQNSELS